MKNYFSIEQKAETADIYIFGDITEYAWEEMGEVSAMSLTRQLKELDADIINVHIDSYGGSVSEGWAIYNSLLQHKAKVNTFADGFVASAALYPFLAGDTRTASSLSAFYMHEAMTSAYGYADDLRKAAETAETMTDIGVRAFVERAGMDEDTVRALMREETWLTPAEALENGIATVITAEKPSGTQQSAKPAILQNLFRKAEPAPAPTPEPAKPTIMEMLMNMSRKD